MPHSIRNEEQLAHAKQFAISDFPDLIPDSTVAFAVCKAVPEIVEEVGDSPRLHIKYGSIDIENGQNISPDELLAEPDVSIESKEGTYTLMMIDADAPSPSKPNYRSWLHWLVINIPANDVVRGEVVEPYQPPAPSKARHRYMWLLFKQKGRVKARAPSKRQGFQVKEWAKQHDFGNPVNGLFIWSAADEA